MNGRKLRAPSRSMTSISPGSMSRMYSASMSSKAQVSDATTQPFFLCRPSDSGRMPSGSRTAIMEDSVRKASE
jgi:hypothetical protein